MNSRLEISLRVQQVLCLWRLLWKRLWSSSCRRGGTNVSALNSTLSTHHWIPLVNSKVFIVLFNILVPWNHGIYSETCMVKDKTMALSMETQIWFWEILDFFYFLISYRWESGGGCSSAGRAGRPVIGRSLVQIPALGRAELHVEVSLSKILNPTLLISEGPGDLSREYPALALRQSWDWLQQQHPTTPWKGISGYGQWHYMTDENQ